MNKILNLTQHKATQEQIEQGVFDLHEEKREELKKLLTIEELPDTMKLHRRAHDISKLALDAGAKTVMIGGAHYLMSYLEAALINFGIKPVYAFSKRESVEKTDEHGNVIKINMFKHIGFVEV